MAPSTESPSSTAPSAQEVIHAFGRASALKRTLMVAGGLVALGSAPYWVPVAWRSKKVRGLLAGGAKVALGRWFT